MTHVALTDRHKSVRNRCAIEHFCGVYVYMLLWLYIVCLCQICSLSLWTLHNCSKWWDTIDIFIVSSRFIWQSLLHAFRPDSKCTCLVGLILAYRSVIAQEQCGFPRVWEDQNVLVKSSLAVRRNNVHMCLSYSLYISEMLPWYR